MKVQRGLIRQQLEQMQAEGLTQKEQAARLGIAPTSVWYWRDRLGVPPPDRFAVQFERTYGPGSMAKLHQLFREGATMRAIGATFGFSHQYASQLATQLGYTRAGTRTASKQQKTC